MKNWLTQAARLVAEGESFVLVTVAGVRGSAPREIGASMIVTARETFGTIGGGQLEYQCSKTAVQRLREDNVQAGGALRRFPLGANCGQCCGGVVDVLFDTLTPDLRWVSRLCEVEDSGASATLCRWRNADGRVAHAILDRNDDVDGSVASQVDDSAVRNALLQVRQDGRGRTLNAADGSVVLLQSLRGVRSTIAVFGAGHVGTATVAVLATLDVDIRWIDSRASLLPADAPRNVQTLHSSDPAREVAALPPGTWYLVMTHSHPLDFDICSAVLGRGDFAYLGLIGSLSKRRRFEKRFRRQAISGVERLSCPIGTSGISGKAPAEIAIAVAADLLQRREAAQPGAVHRRLQPIRGDRKAV